MRRGTSSALVLATVAATLTASVDGAAASTRPLDQCSRVTVVGHRGGSAATENTLAAALDGAAAGAQVFETDLRLTRDGYWVLMHDASIDRTVHGRGRVAALTYRQIAARTMTDGQPAQISMTRVLTAYHRSYPTKGLQLELKVGATPSRLRALAATLRRIGVAGQTTITSFSPGYLYQFVRANGHGFRLGLISDQAVPLTTAMRYAFVVVSAAAGGLTADYVAALHAQRRRVYVWDFGRSEATYQRMVGAGVDAFTADDVAQVVARCAAYSTPAPPTPAPTPAPAPTASPTPTPTSTPTQDPGPSANDHADADADADRQHPVDGRATRPPGSTASR